MKKLGYLKASSIEVGDVISVMGYKTEVTSVKKQGVRVTMQTKMFEGVEYTSEDRVCIYNNFS